jgi:Na+/proline symporter
MNTHYLDITIIIFFLISTLVLGYLNTDGLKGINAFALGRRSPSPGALTSTIIATWASGSGFMVTLSETYLEGWYYLIPSLCMSLSLVIVAIVIVPRMQDFIGKTTVAATMGKIYGPKVRMITAVAGTIGVSGSIAVQFKVCGNIGHEIFGYPREWYIIIMGIMIIWYSIVGGIESVIKTDIIQMAAFSIAVPIVLLMIYITFTGNDFLEFTKVDKFNLSHVFGTYDPKILDMVLLGLYFAIPSMNPATVQRVSMGLSMNQVKKAWLIAAIVLFIIELFSAVLPVYIYTINPNLKEGEILGFIINNFTLPGIRGLLAVGIIAMAMSTADSYLNISSVLIANDIWKAHTLDNASKLLNARKFTALIGMAAIIFAIYGGSFLKIILFTNSFYMPIVTVPLLFTIFKYKTSEKCVLSAMAAGLITVVGIRLSPINIDPIIPGMAVNAITLVICTKLFYNKVTYTVE